MFPRPFKVHRYVYIFTWIHNAYLYMYICVHLLRVLCSFTYVLYNGAYLCSIFFISPRYDLFTQALIYLCLFLHLFTLMNVCAQDALMVSVQWLHIDIIYIYAYLFKYTYTQDAILFNVQRSYIDHTYTYICIFTYFYIHTQDALMFNVQRLEKQMNCVDVGILVWSLGTHKCICLYL